MKEYKKLDGFYIEEGEKLLAKDILPGIYISQNLDKKNIDVDYVVNFLQNELNSILNSFLNGGFSNKGYILYPFIKDVSKENLYKIKALEKIAAFLNNEDYDFSESLGKYKSNVNSGNFAVILSSLYRDFSMIKVKGTKIIKKPACGEFKINEYKKTDLEYLKPLNELKNYADKNLKKYLSGFYLHGSFATKDYVKGWSDVDTLAIISKETMQNPKKLTELRHKIYFMRRFFYEIDPLQHHGSIAISEHDMDNYCQPYFPVPIFRYSKSLLEGDKETKFLARSYESEAINRLFWFVSYFRKLKIEKKEKFGSYDFKNLLHSITLFPTLYLQAKGILVYKKFSFNMAKKDFSKESWKIMDEASNVRNNWAKFGTFPLVNSASRINPLFYYRLNSRIMDLLNQNKFDTKKIMENMHSLSEEAWSKVKNAKKRL